VKSQTHTPRLRFAILDSVEPYLRKILGFIGIDDVQTELAECMNIPPLVIHAVLNGERSLKLL
jgi:FMN-dependent NADH-azoreductase